MNTLSRRGYPASALATVQHLTFTQNTQGMWGAPVPAYVHALGPSWSVAIEEQFYLLWPIVVVVMGVRAVVPVALAFFVLSMIARAAGSPINVIIGRGDGLAFGCVLAAFLRVAQGRAERLRRLSAALTVTASVACAYVVVLAWYWWKEPLPQWRVPTFAAFAVLYFGLIGLVVVHSGAWPLAPLRWKPLRGLGQVSYCLYMVHSPIMLYSPALLTRAGVRSGLLKNMCTWALIAILPIGSYYLLERPILTLKNRFKYGKET
jgi:peptidoglycan/LPS O-acetylase OafA/YrhL